MSGTRREKAGRHASLAPEEGAEVGGYLLIRRLGTGGMSDVYLARPKDPARAGERLALKRLRPDLAQLPDFVELFERETRLARRLDHPNVVRVMDFGTDGDNRCFIVTEYVEGLDCWKITRRLGRQGETLPIDAAVRIVADTLEALEHIHDLADEHGRPLGIVHRDISPSNIFVSRTGAVKLGDYGIAFLPHEEAETKRRKRLRGKIRFLSPEQIAGLPVDRRSDLFAVGVLLAELCLGRSPFQGDTDLAVLLNIRDVRLSLNEDFERNIPRELRILLFQALAREPDDRFPDAGAMRDELRTFAERVGLRQDPAVLADVVGRLLRPGDVGDAEVLRSTLTPLEDAPIGPREPVRLADQERTPSIPTVQYSVRRPDGTEIGPMPYPRLADGVVSGEFTALDHVSADGTGFVPLSAVPAVRQHLPLLDQTTLPVEVPAGPDRRGTLEADTVAGVFLLLAAKAEKGLLVFEAQGVRKEVYLAEGNPIYVTSNVRGEQFAEYLLANRLLDRTQLDVAVALMPRYGGRLADALIAMEAIDPVTLFEHLSTHLRQRLLDVYSWRTGKWSFYRDVACDRDFFLNPAGAALLRDGISLSLPAQEEEGWWSATAPLMLVPERSPAPPRDWWPLDDTDRLLLGLVDRRVSALDLAGLARDRLPDLDPRTFRRSLHFCLTSGLIGIAWG
ncbi:MAG: serine/threonine protein kinase [Deltaproteobacteria bacterium]|nr:serine/threonine protein kinase [Deltaproteobacteria bacterium]